MDFSYDTWGENFAGGETQSPNYADTEIESDIEIAPEQQANNVFGNMRTFKATIIRPLVYDITIPPVGNLSNNERSSIDFHTLMSTEYGYQASTKECLGLCQFPFGRKRCRAMLKLQPFKAWRWRKALRNNQTAILGRLTGSPGYIRAI
ncbi:hypothetical protein MAM1_0191d07669 [Mucor ambiguus]|uniref:Uncharacterized protein n=1 Tax=Mucor ambiguus TaxID=91626 RepID=A0A0C9MX69_9FUNG|nr:hypothetical protein MAM1_0191d07669 [Mucor ambiguus]